MNIDRVMDILISVLILANVIVRVFDKFIILSFVLSTIAYGVVILIIVQNSKHIIGYRKLLPVVGGFILWSNILVCFLGKL